MYLVVAIETALVELNLENKKQLVNHISANWKISGDSKSINSKHLYFNATYNKFRKWL